MNKLSENEKNKIKFLKAKTKFKKVQQKAFGKKKTQRKKAK